MKRMIKSNKSILWVNELSNRITSLFFFCSLTAFILYLLGNFQNFLDETHFMLLRIILICGIIAFIAGCNTIIMLIVESIVGKHMQIKRFLKTIFMILLSVVMIILSQIVLTWA